MQLPKALAPWASMLKMFPDDIALSLGELMQRVSMILGPLHSSLTKGNEEPDGYEGIPAVVITIDY